ncbi:MAG: NAD(P)/FAD-dependent oxidoreductase [Spirochaetes bacterium]|nr:NAD(P)/FAD-dependent oxidoreductase [Spirochaetota bacterium]
MKKSIIIIGSGMGGLAAGIYGQSNGFKTTIFEAHHLPGGQCTSWKRKGYVFDACLHTLNGLKPDTKTYAFWQELGAVPCENVKRNEFVSAIDSGGNNFHHYFDLEKLESHMKQLSPEDGKLIDEYIKCIKSFLSINDMLGITNFGTFWEKLRIVPFFLSKLKQFQYTMATYAKKFKHPFLRKAFPYIRNSLPDMPLFGYLAEYTSYITGDSGWPRGGGLMFSKNMADYYKQLGGVIHYKKNVVKILTENNRASGVELEDGTQFTADYIISNADGRKTILEMLDGKYMNKKVARYCEPFPDNFEVAFSVIVYLGVKRDLSSCPSALLQFLDQPEEIGGHCFDHLHMQIFGFDTSMAPAGKGVIKVELFTKASHFARLYQDKAAYQAEKNKIGNKVINLLEKQFPGLRADVEVVDIATLNTWERYMGGTLGHNNFPYKYKNLTDIRNIMDFIFGLNKMFNLPGLKNFYFTGQWVTSMGSLFSNALTGKNVIQKICKHCGVKFVK